MKLIDMFNRAMKQCDILLDLHKALLTTNSRSVRSEWKSRFFDAKLVKWAMRDGLWRSTGKSILILGNNHSQLTHESFSSEYLSVFLRSAIVLCFAAIDKILHEAVSNNFVNLVRSESLDKIVRLEVSKCYEIAQGARIRRGKGGKSRSRPGHKIKTEVLSRIYSETFLAPRRLEEICAWLGVPHVFDRFGNTLKPRKRNEEIKREWARLYCRRNQIAHEGDIIRKAKGQKIHFHSVRADMIRQDVDWVRGFGSFICQSLHRS